MVSVFILFRFGRESVSVIGNIGALGCVAGLFLALAGMAFLQALVLTTVANTLFVLGAIPFIAALLARILLKEKLNRATLLTMFVAAAGLVVMVLEGLTIGSAAGNGYALLTALFFALYAVILRSNRQKDMLPTLLISSLVIIIVSVIVQAGDLGHFAARHDIEFYLGRPAFRGGERLFYLRFPAPRRRRSNAVHAAGILPRPIWVWLVVSEQPTRWTIIGGLLIILAVTVRAVIELIGDGPRPAKHTANSWLNR